MLVAPGGLGDTIVFSPVFQAAGGIESIAEETVYKAATEFLDATAGSGKNDKKKD